jgi:co-chaperonin GroES (HSP10)
MKAIGKYVVIQEVKSNNTVTSKGLELTEKTREDVRYREGVVVMPGTDVSCIKKDDTIYFDRHAGFKVDIGDSYYKVIKESDIVIVL